MPPKRKPNSSSTTKKLNQQSQPSKFGIQHFFDRHTQNAAASASNFQNPKIKPNNSNESSQTPNPPKPQSQSSPPQTIPVFTIPTSNSTSVVANSSEVSPEISKSNPFNKRFKFSPGMLIKQSQDDGGEEVTWKISPVNERLQAVSKRLPDVIRVLGDSSKPNFRPCSQNSEGKLEKWLSSPTLKISRALVSNESGKVEQSPFRTPPSVSDCCPDKMANGTLSKEALDQLGSQQHRKALLELLDQVEDVITVEDSEPNNWEKCLYKVEETKGDNMSIKAIPLVKTTQRPDQFSSDLNFLVLEVSEKHKATDSSYTRGPLKVLRLLNEQSGNERLLHLHDEWFYSIIGPGDTVNVIGEFDKEGKCVVDRGTNLVVVHPDILVSGTRVASSFGCIRRSVLDERLKSNDHSIAALLGIMLHQIFQAGLVKECPTKDFLEDYARIVLQKNIESMYACGVNENDMHTRLIDAIPKILNWIICCRVSQESKALIADFGSINEQRKINITEVIDIEEMAWAPRYGLKGMIDVSVRVKVDSSINEASEVIMPLEFKSGKGTTGQSFMEHRAQVVLYTILMSERYLKPIDSGLLYYLHTDQTHGIRVQRSDLIGLIMRRNELANDILKASITQKLPQMIQNPNICKSCRHLNVCTAYHKAHGGNTDSSGLGDLFDSNVNHLTILHLDFLRQWDRLIDLEAKETQTVKQDFWQSANLSERSNGISSVVLDISNDFSSSKSLKDGRFIYRFVRKDLPVQDSEVDVGETVDATYSKANNLDYILKSGDYVMLSTGSGHLAVSNGVIADISRSHVSVSFSRRLRLPRSSPTSESVDLIREVWRIDKDEFTTSYSIMRFNLVQLFVQSSHSSHLRKAIVDLEAPKFDSGLIVSQDPAISYIRSEKNLNQDQRRAIHKILTAKDYALILGMPGTGKTSTMVHAVKALLMRGASILLTSYTNSAVDNLLIKLKSQGIDFVRIGRYEAVHEEVRDYCFSARDPCGVEDIKVRLDQVKVVAVTCLGITHPLLSKKKFDICIMDEAGQTTLPVSLGPLMFASTFVLVGDHYQLPPLVQSAEARENGMGISLFCRLSEAHPQAISALQSQYRMCAGIMELSNTLIYGNRLCCGSTKVEKAKLMFLSAKSTTPWLKEVLDPSRSVVLINTDMLPALEVKEQKTVNNPMEAYIVAGITEELVKKGISEEEIGIITPYNSQVNFIRRVIGATTVEIHTIDKYQGRDKDCILVSFVRSTENPRASGSSSLLGDWHRINVALTRAKKKLIMVGSCKTLSKVPLLKLMIEKVDEQCGIMTVSKKDVHHLGQLKRCSQINHCVK